MSNTFSGTGAGTGHDLNLSNGATEVFIDVLMLAVSDLASEPWDFRFAALLSLQDQTIMGRGDVGFDLTEFDWGATERERARAKDFVLSAVALAASGHRWSELGYYPPRAHDYLRHFTTMVESCTPSAGSGAADGFPGPDEAAMASCVRHRILTALPLWEGCFLCNRLPPAS
ncbi:hypothetical protein [Streptomyces sp. KLOTTS4A1]|uniref:hypothetical protein n=1 Tax=Streptomyces sp. KLOTTS4A1 TaxID=3390996 RepID=UPI0039F4CF96